MIIYTVKDMIEYLSDKDPDMKITVRFFDGCSCCNSGEFEEMSAEIINEEIRLV